MKRRPALSMSSAQNGSVPSARIGSAIVWADAALRVVSTDALESAGRGLRSPHAAVNATMTTQRGIGDITRSASGLPSTSKAERLRLSLHKDLKDRSLKRKM